MKSYAVYKISDGLVQWRENIDDANYINRASELSSQGFGLTDKVCMISSPKVKFNSASQTFTDAATSAEMDEYQARGVVNVMVTADGVFVKDIGDGEMKKITVDNGIVKIE